MLNSQKNSAPRVGVRDRQRTPTGDRVAGDVTSGGLHSHQSR